MTEILSQDEIDQLLTAINTSDNFENKFSNIKEFEKYLLKRNVKQEKPYGVFTRDISICSFFSSGSNENLLEDIKLKNEKEGFGNIKIPNTNITLINFSICPECKTVYSLNDITKYYMNPVSDTRFNSRANQFRTDTRVYCKNCKTYFLPSLVISDGTPKNEVQFLCRTQTIDAIENFFIKRDVKVLTKNARNILQNNELRAIRNDVFIKNMEEKPALITNMIQYTPFNLILNLIDGSNVKKRDLLFDQWK